MEIRIQILLNIVSSLLPLNLPLISVKNLNYIKENMMKKRKKKNFYDIEIFYIIVDLTNFKWFFRDGNAKLTLFVPIKSYLFNFWKIIHFH
jgi:hypothetical protein